MDEQADKSTPSNATEGTARTDVTFGSGNETCAATLYRPAGPRGDRVPCVVMAPGVSQTRRDGFLRYAHRFAQAGLAALVFDFRHLGDSEGEPRQLIDFQRQRADLAAAVSFARTLDGVDPDRIAGWGFSFGGGHAVHVAAHDHRLAAAVTLCPFVDGLAFSLAGDTRNNLRLMGAAGKALMQRQPIRMAVAGPPGQLALFTQPEAARGFDAVRGEDSRWRNEILAKPTQPPARIRPVREARRVRCPLLVGLGSEDTIVPARPIRRLAEQAPHARLHHVPGGHFDAFLEHVDQVANEHVAFLTHHLLSDPPPG